MCLDVGGCVLLWVWCWFCCCFLVCCVVVYRFFCFCGLVLGSMVCWDRGMIWCFCWWRLGCWWFVLILGLLCGFCCWWVWCSVFFCICSCVWCFCVWFFCWCVCWFVDSWLGLLSVCWVFGMMVLWCVLLEIVVWVCVWVWSWLCFFILFVVLCVFFFVECVFVCG